MELRIEDDTQLSFYEDKRLYPGMTLLLNDKDTVRYHCWKPLCLN